jgi:predicted  nucleic acid-binding Zn-ribbon protein
MSDEVVALIDRLIEEHRIINQNLESLETVVNDAGAILNFEKAKETYMPGRNTSKQDLETMDKLLDSIDEGLRGHFNREEQGLHKAFDTVGTKEMSEAFSTLVKEHDTLRERLSEHGNIRNSLFEALKSPNEGRGSMTRHQWEAKAHDMRAYIMHSRRMVQEHTVRESKLFHSLKETLLSGAKE